jgi:hypothetical protein
MNFNYTKFLSVSSFFALLLIICGLSACRSGKDDPVTVINTITHGSVSHGTKNILLIRDNACPNCSQRLVRFAGSITSHKDCLTVVAADPDKIDLSPVLAAPQCFMDSERLLDRNDIFPNNSFVQVKNGTVASFTELTAGNLDSFINSFACKN